MVSVATYPFSFLFIIVYSVTVSQFFPLWLPLLSSAPTLPFHSHSPHYCQCPWVIHKWFLFIWVIYLLFLISLVKALSVLFIFSKNELWFSSIFCTFLHSFISTLILLFLWIFIVFSILPLYWIHLSVLVVFLEIFRFLYVTFYWFLTLLIVLFLFLFSISLDCLFEILLVSWYRSLLIWISLLQLLLLCLIDL